MGLRSALYNWPAKIEHWPTDSNGFFTGKQSVVQNTAVFSDINLTHVNRPANAQFWPANCKVQSLLHPVPGRRITDRCERTHPFSCSAFQFRPPRAPKRAGWVSTLRLKRPRDAAQPPGAGARTPRLRLGLRPADQLSAGRQPRVGRVRPLVALDPQRPRELLLPALQREPAPRDLRARRSNGVGRRQQRRCPHSGVGRGVSTGVSQRVPADPPASPTSTCSLSLGPRHLRNQRDEMQVEWTGLHHLFSAAGRPPLPRSSRTRPVVAFPIGASGPDDATKEMAGR